MRLPLILGLFALTAVNLFAQSARPLPLDLAAVELFDAQEIAASGSIESEPVADPHELLSIELHISSDDAAALDLGDLTLTVAYASDRDGPYTAPVDTVSSNVTDTVSFTSTTSAEGVDFRGAPAKWAKFTLANGNGSVDVSLLRLTAVRQRIGGPARPHALVMVAVDMGIAVDALADDTESVSSTAKADPREFQAFSYDSNGSTGTREIRFFYSNSPDGPFVPWRDEGVETVAYQNSVSSTALDSMVTAKLFPALYFQAKFYNGSGAATDVTHVHGIRRAQSKR